MAEEIFEYDENDNELVNVHYKVSNTFIEGMSAAAKILLETSKPRFMEGERNRMLTSNPLFNMEPADFAYTILEMDIRELRCNMLGAHLLVENLREQLEDLSYQIAEAEKHGTGHF